VTQGIGIDIEAISRFEQLRRPEAFRQRFFTEAERKQLEIADESLRLLALMWVVKEAVIKAAWRLVRLFPSDIEVQVYGRQVRVRILAERLPPRYACRVTATFPDDQVMAVAQLTEV